MEEVYRTTNPVDLSYAMHLLAEAGVEAFCADQFISAVEGSIGAFPRRVMVLREDLAGARLALTPLLGDRS